MATLSELVHEHTELTPADVDWLHALLGEWQLVADLSFADLVLWVRVREQSAPEGAYLVVAQMRPTTGVTSHRMDLIGTRRAAHDAHRVDRAWRTGRICREGEPEWSHGVPIRQETIPVRHQGRVVAVVGRDTNLAAARMPSQLELTYVRAAGELAQMIAEGTFPFPDSSPDLETGPRVGDGLVHLDLAGRVAYASPNALSAYRRLGVRADLLGADLGVLTATLVDAPPGGLDDPRVTAALDLGRPHESEIEANGVVVLLRAIPLRPAGRLTGALVLLRDVTELRRRDRALLSKDATIREIHHRVKNNLQTVAALLRLQSRRLGEPARTALEESVRRVSAIAVVHETLSLALDQTVGFDDIADRVVSMVSEMTASDVAIRTRRTGSFGVLPAEIAMPLSLVLTELSQNAIEHAVGARGGTLEIAVGRRGRVLEVAVRDDGDGLPPGFEAESSARLGLQIVRTLVVGELRGGLELRARPGPGTEVLVSVPLVAEPDGAV